MSGLPRPGRRRLLLLAALALLAMAAPDPGLPVRRPVYDVVVVIDITQSMNVTDYSLAGQPVSRLDYAKAALRLALLDLPCGSTVGWGVFAEYRTLLLAAPAEVCANYGDMIGLLERIDNRMAWTNASQVGKGLISALKAVQGLPGGPGLVFISDGHEAPPLRPPYRPRFDGRPGAVAGALVGAGGSEPRPIPMSDPEGRPLGFWGERDVEQLDGRGGRAGEHLSWLHEDNLIALAGEIGFDYRPLRTPADLRQVLTAPNLAREKPARLPLAAPLALLALLAIVAVFVEPARLRLWLARRTRSTATGRDLPGRRGTAGPGRGAV